MSKKKSQVLNCLDELEAIASARNNKEQSDLIHSAEDCVIDSISEIALNCLEGKIPLKSCDFKKLKKYREILEELAGKNPADYRRELLLDQLQSQRGGFILPALLSAGLAYLASEAGGYIYDKLAGK